MNLAAIGDRSGKSSEHSEAAKVTFVAHEIHTLGGMEKQLAELILGLLRHGFHITVVARRCELGSAVSSASLRWIRVPGPARPFSLAYPWFLIVGSWLVRRHRSGLLHTTGAIVLNHSDLSTVHFCHEAAKAKGVPVSRGRTRGLPYYLNDFLTRVMSRQLEKFCYRPSRAGDLVAVSRGGEYEIRKHFPAMGEAVIAIPNGVDREVFRPDRVARQQIRSELGLHQSDFVAIFVGGDWERKGLRFAIEGVMETTGCHLLVLGSGDVQSLRISRTYARWQSRVHFLGIRTDVNRYLAAADAFVFPTSYENFPLVTLEAAATGLPLLATRVNGIEDLLEDGRNGWFVERDAVSIAQKLCRLRDDPRLRVEMGATSRYRAGEYSWERMVDSYVQLYRRLESDQSLTRS